MDSIVVDTIYVATNSPAADIVKHLCIALVLSLVVVTIYLFGNLFSRQMRGRDCK